MYASQDSYFERTVNIAYIHSDMYTDEIIAESEWLLSNKFTHVDYWSNPLITPDVYKIFSKNYQPRNQLINTLHK